MKNYSHLKKHEIFTFQHYLLYISLWNRAQTSGWNSSILLWIVSAGPEIVQAMPAEGVEKVKIDRVSRSGTRSILTFSTPSAGIASTISGAIVEREQDDCVPADTIHSKIDGFEYNGVMRRWSTLIPLIPCPGRSRQARGDAPTAVCWWGRESKGSFQNKNGCSNMVTPYFGTYFWKPFTFQVWLLLY